MIELNRIRNFSIIAHIDHGKSTLADRFIQVCNGLSEREMLSQVLDSMDLERERGITIKAQSVALDYQLETGEAYQLNLIDTPGHVDFSYEVSRSLAACEGALLVVDATQGVEAQTVANCLTALEQGLEIIPVLNKVDLDQAEPARVKRDIEDIIGLDTSLALEVSAKTGLGVKGLMQQLIDLVPPPKGDRQLALQALIIDSWFDRYLGVVSLVRVVAGILRPNDRIMSVSDGKVYQVDVVGIYTPTRCERPLLAAGEVGFVVASIKNIHGAPVGDTLIHAEHPDTPALPGFQPVKPQVYAGLFPIASDQFENFRAALSKLALNDSALVFEPEISAALGFGFRCGFLGLLHMEIVQERLEREYQLDLITTSPTVAYEILLRNGELLQVDNPSCLPRPERIEEMREPVALVTILTPKEYVGNIMSLCVDRRGEQRKMDYLGSQVSMVFLLPMIEVISDFFGRLKSVSRGYASLDYSFLCFRKAPLVTLSILINGESVDALATVIHRDQAQSRGRVLTEKMKELIPRQMFDIAIQAAIGSHIIARHTVKALRKNVTAKCYGGDITRKKKLLAKQSAGKKRMKQLGQVSVPQEAFLAALKIAE